SLEAGPMNPSGRGGGWPERSHMAPVGIGIRDEWGDWTRTNTDTRCSYDARTNEPSPRRRGSCRGRGLPTRPAKPPGTAGVVVATRRRPRRHPPTVLVGAAPWPVVHAPRDRPPGGPAARGA